MPASYPNKDYVWDNWVRERALKNRDSIIPEIPRTKHIGSRGTNVGLSMQKRFFETMAFNQERGVQYKGKLITLIKVEVTMCICTLGLTQLTKADYDAYLHSAISAAKVVVLAPGAQPCGPDFLAGNGSVTQDRVSFNQFMPDNDLVDHSVASRCSTSIKKTKVTCPPGRPLPSATSSGSVAPEAPTSGCTTWGLGEPDCSL